MDSAFSNLDLVVQCAADEERSSAFAAAIREVVRPGMKVLDLGTGTGLLALLAARAGAERVIAIERDAVIAEVARRNAAVNGCQGVVSVLNEDAATFRFSHLGQFDVVIAEMLTTGMIDEAQVATCNNLHSRQRTHDGTRFIPSRISTFVEVGHMDFSLQSLQFPMARHLWQGFPDRDLWRPRTDRVHFRTERFDRPIDAAVRGRVTAIPVESGSVNAVCLHSRTELTTSVFLGDTLAMNAPVALPVPKGQIARGAPCDIFLSYVYGGGYQRVSVAVGDEALASHDCAGP